MNTQYSDPPSSTSASRFGHIRVTCTGRPPAQSCRCVSCQSVRSSTLGADAELQDVDVFGHQTHPCWSANNRRPRSGGNALTPASAAVILWRSACAPTIQGYPHVPILRPHRRADLGHEVPPQGGGRHARSTARSRIPGAASPARWPRSRPTPPSGKTAFYAALEGFRFLPAGRITAGAGTGAVGHAVQLLRHGHDPRQPWTASSRC